jgi:hypothetical protein
LGGGSQKTGSVCTFLRFTEKLCEMSTKLI